MKERAVTISVVVPVYREAAYLPEVLDRTRKELDALDEAWEIIFVDDGSPDETWSAIVGESGRIPQLRALRLSRNFGKEAALCAGLEAARGEAVIVMDGDGQHPPELLGEMVRVWRGTDADIVEGRKVRHRRESLPARCGHRAFYWMMRKLSGFDLTGASDFKLMNRRVVEAWMKLGERNLFFRGMIAWLGFRREQIPFEVPRRAGGRTRWSLGRLLSLGGTGLTAFSSLPLRFASLLGCVFFLFAVAFGVYALVLKLTGHAVTGFTTVILLQLIIGSFLMLLLGIIGEYVARIYEEVKGRPRYVVSEVLDRDSNADSPAREEADG